MNSNGSLEQQNHLIGRMIAAEFLEPITPDEWKAATAAIGKLKQVIEQPATGERLFNLTFPKQPVNVHNYAGANFN